MKKPSPIKRIVEFLVREGLYVLILWLVNIYVEQRMIPAVVSMYPDAEGTQSLVWQTIVLLVASIPLWCFFCYHDSEWDNLTAENGEIPSVGQSLVWSVCTLSFLLHGALTALLPPLLGITDYLPRLIFPAAAGDPFFRIGLALIVYSLPMFVIFLVCHALIRRRIVRGILRGEESDGKKDSRRLGVGKILLNILFYGAGLLLLPYVLVGLAAFASCLTVLTSYVGQIVAIAVVILLLVLFLRVFRAGNRRRNFERTLKKVCAERGFPFENLHKPFRGLFYCTSKIEYRVETKEKRYDASFLPIPRKGVWLYFDPHGGYRFGFRIFGKRGRFACHRLPAPSQPEGEDKLVETVIVLSEEPRQTLYGDTDRAYEVYNGNHFHELYIWESSAFCNLLDRMEK